MLFRSDKSKMVDAETAHAGHPAPTFNVPEYHAVKMARIQPPYPDGLEIAYFGMGCFWGAERLFWKLPGVYSTAVGYAGGFSPNPTYEEVCSGKTGHAEIVQVVFDPKKVSYRDLLATFWEEHNPTEGMRQGNDVGTQYRSAILTTSDEQARIARESRDAYQAELNRSGFGEISTEIEPLDAFYYAEDYHQQYLHKVPNGYCGLAGTGVSCPIRLKVPAASAS
jgi:peptide-methionine (S)-S-oxide reductase